MDLKTIPAERLESRCQEQWQELGLNSIEDVKAHILRIFDKAEDQNEIIINLYRLLFPDWDRIHKIHGYPNVGEELWKFIARQFQGFDKKHHPKTLPGGAWMNLGFASSPELEPWEISFADCTAELAPKAA